MPQTTNTAPAASTNTTVKTPKPVSKWRYRIIITLLLLVIIALLGGSAYGGWYLWKQGEDRKTQISKLESEVDTLKKERNVSVEDLQNQLKAQETQLIDLTAENKRLSDDLTKAKAQVDQLTPKNIKDYNYKTIKRINEAGGDIWLNPIYVDVTGDGKEDGIFAYRQAGTGGFLNVYVYSYLNTNTLTELLKAEGYQRGIVTHIAESNIVEIRSEAGTPDAPTVASSKFKYDSLTKKLVKLP